MPLRAPAKLMSDESMGGQNTMRKQDNSKASAGSAPVAEPAAAGGSPPEPKRANGPRDGLVLLCIIIVSAAISVMLFTQFGLSLPASALAGAGAWTVFMLTHKQVQKTAQIAQLKAELARARGNGPRLKGAPRAAPLSPLEAAAANAIETRAPDLGAVMPQADSSLADSVRPDLARPDLAGPDLARADFTRPDAPPADMAMHSQQTSSPDRIDIHMQPFTAPESFAPLARGDNAGTEPPPNVEAIREQWSFRPRTEPRGPSQGPGEATSGLSALPTGTATTIEGDLELVQRKIKELADEVNSAEALRPAKPPRSDARARATADVIENSIGALKAAASSMRDRRTTDFSPTFSIPSPVAPPAAPGLGDLVIPATAKRIAGSDFGARSVEAEPPRLDVPLPDLPLPDFPRMDFSAAPVPTSGSSPRAAAIARAIEADAMDVFLGPIVTLKEHSVSHYEMTVGLNSSDGKQLEADDGDFNLAGGELCTRFDSARLTCAAALTARMEARDKDGLLLTEFTGASLTSRAFLEAFAGVYEARPRIAGQLVLTFAQRAVDSFTPAAWEAVGDMHAFGFRFALDKVEHVKTDFAALAHSGFRFVRLDAEMLLNGVAAHDRFVSADEIYQRATLAGFSIIATGIGDAKTQKRLLESGILLGQGPLFGASRQVSLNGTSPPNRSAAA
jgi:cyclic-di-GMP phosphodiesterase TipF (flagellum assembly factor)